MIKIKNILKVALVLMIFTSLTSCDLGGEPDQEGTTTGKFAGDWWIDITDSNGGLLVQHALTSTYNTAANDNTMWIDDDKHGWWIKCKMTINTETGEFSATDSPNIIDSGTVTITDGKITFGTGTSKGGHKVDSISFKAEFSYDPGNILLFEGTKWTGFLEDEY